MRGGVHPETVKRDAIRQNQLIVLGARAIGVRRWFALKLPDPNARSDSAESAQEPRAKRRSGETPAEPERLRQSQPAE
jgi:hypothetical protein